MKIASSSEAPPSDWVVRWSHLVPRDGKVLDVACGQGRHMKWFHSLGFQVIGIDQNPQSLATASIWGETVQADIENQAWPLKDLHGGTKQFAAVVVTNYLWRPLFTTLFNSVADGGIFIYETFAEGNQVFGKPSRPDFLLKEGELLESCKLTPGFRVLAYENGFLVNPDRCVQRVVAIKAQKVADIQQSKLVLQQALFGS